MGYTSYAPEVYSRLKGIVLVCKPPYISFKEYLNSLSSRLSDQFNLLEPRPLSKRLVIAGGLDEPKEITQEPNLADHPLVVGPRYLPWEMKLYSPYYLGYRTSGVVPILFRTKSQAGKIVNVYQISGKFGYITDTFFSDGKIVDKSTFKHIKSDKLDAALAKIESSQYDRLFDSTKIQMSSQEGYELAKNWPQMPPKMATWPVIYKIRCIHLKLPEFKLEVTCINERETFLAQLSHDLGLMLKSGAYTESIRRVRVGDFDIEDALTDNEWTLQNIIAKLKDPYRVS